MQDDRPGIVIAGAAGRMGRMLIAAVLERGDLCLHAAIEASGSAAIGADAGRLAGREDAGLLVVEEADEALAGAAAVIDFTLPEATLSLSRRAARAGVAHVIGTTGLDESALSAIAEAARAIPVVRAGNMSLGVNLLVGLTRRVAAALGPDWDIEIVEAHHRHKRDAPSGTALMLGEAAAEGRGVSLPEVSERGRDGITGPRAPGAIGFSAIRGGEIVGEHEVILAGPGEVIRLGHVAQDRAIFARGALAAALWATGRAPGEYSMADVLGL